MRPRRIAAWVAAACVAGLAAWGFRAMQGGCTYELLSSHPSPDGAWRADDVLSMCGAGFGTDYAVVTLRLSRPDSDAAPTDILGLDYGDDDDLKVEWTAPESLRITVPDGGYLKVLTRRVGPIAVDIERSETEAQQ